MCVFFSKDEECTLRNNSEEPFSTGISVPPAWDSDGWVNMLMYAIYFGEENFHLLLPKIQSPTNIYYFDETMLLLKHVQSNPFAMLL